jgi:hypothetical protein
MVPKSRETDYPFKIKYNPDPVILKTSNLSNEKKIRPLLNALRRKYHNRQILKCEALRVKPIKLSHKAYNNNAVSAHGSWFMAHGSDI